MHLCFSIEKISSVSCWNKFNAKFEYIKKLVLSVLIKIETSNIKNKTSQMCNFGDIIGMTNVEHFQYVLSKKIKRGNIKCRDQKSLSLSSYLNWGYNTILGPNIKNLIWTRIWRWNSMGQPRELCERATMISTYTQCLLCPVQWLMEWQMNSIWKALRAAIW